MVSTKTRQVIWGKGAGRCYFCNTSLIGDLIAGNEDANFGFVAHIVGEKIHGPRGDAERSPLLEDDYKNLMLMCYVHHKLIDVDEVDGYPESVLLQMKRKHEERIAVVADIKPGRASHVLLYGAKIGRLESPVSYDRARIAMLPQRYPADGRSIGIEILGNALTDDEELFWKTEPENLRRQFDSILRPRITSREITHLSVFGLGPIPLLVSLGALLGDIVPADVYQLHREPTQGWPWAEDGPNLTFRIDRPAGKGETVALKLAVSATVTDERVHAALGNDVPVWSVTSDRVGNDVMRHAADLREFRTIMRKLYDDIKAHHGEKAKIHVFPAVPVSVAIELGRVRMPKSDLPLLVYDSIREKGFLPRLEIA
jgi:SMODS-associated and fused to various effectors sensor domain